MSPKSEQTDQQPGADRFWGQFSQSKAGRSTGGEHPSGENRNGEPDADSGPNSEHCLEWCPICRSAELFRATVPPELRQQAESIQHEAIGVLKAFLDAYADKSAGEPGPAPSSGHATPDREEPEEPAAPRVTDIPLE